MIPTFLLELTNPSGQIAMCLKEKELGGRHSNHPVINKETEAGSGHRTSQSHVL